MDKNTDPDSWDFHFKKDQEKTAVANKTASNMNKETGSLKIRKERKEKTKSKEFNNKQRIFPRSHPPKKSDGN